MPKFSFNCMCGFVFHCLRSVPPESIKCPECNLDMKRMILPASMRMVEVLDNGLMSRKVERPANAEQLYKDRAKQAEQDKNKL